MTNQTFTFQDKNCEINFFGCFNSFSDKFCFSRYLNNVRLVLDIELENVKSCRIATTTSEFSLVDFILRRFMLIHDLYDLRNLRAHSYRVSPSS